MGTHNRKEEEGGSGSDNTESEVCIMAIIAQKQCRRARTVKAKAKTRTTTTTTQARTQRADIASSSRRGAAAQVATAASLFVSSLGGVRAAMAEADYTRTCVQLPTACPKKLPDGAKKEEK